MGHEAGTLRIELCPLKRLKAKGIMPCFWPFFQIVYKMYRAMSGEFA